MGNKIEYLIEIQKSLLRDQGNSPLIHMANINLEGNQDNVIRKIKSL